MDILGRMVVSHLGNRAAQGRLFGYSSGEYIHQLAQIPLKSNCPTNLEQLDIQVRSMGNINGTLGIISHLAIAHHIVEPS